MLHTISNSSHIYKKKCEYFTNTINCNDPYVLTIKAIFRDSSLMANALKIKLIEQRHDLTFSPMQQRMKKNLNNRNVLWWAFTIFFSGIHIYLEIWHIQC